MSIFCIGITGGIASGKSTAVNFFREYGAGIIDSDAIAHELVEPNKPAYKKIIAHFAPSILTADKNIDRKKLRQIIFESPIEKQWLESLLHPLIHQELQKQSQEIQAPYAIIDIPLLNNPNDFPYLDRILVIDCSEETQTARVMQRDNITKDTAERMIHAQISREKRNAFADDIILNDTDDLDALRNLVEKLHQDYLKKC
jgi:dephospho-CoA kinase